MPMDTFLARNELITALCNRGFTEGRPNPTGWEYKHADGFQLWFNSRGGFKLDLPNGKREMGVANQPSDILDSIDREAAAL